MKVSQIVVEYGLTVNAGNYNSERVAVGYTAQLEPGDLQEEVTDALIGRARHAVRFQLSQSDNPNVRGFVERHADEDSDSPF